MLWNKMSFVLNIVCGCDEKNARVVLIIIKNEKRMGIKWILHIVKNYVIYVRQYVKVVDKFSARLSWKLLKNLTNGV